MSIDIHVERKMLRVGIWYKLSSLTSVLIKSWTRTGCACLVPSQWPGIQRSRWCELWLSEFHLPKFYRLGTEKLREAFENMVKPLKEPVCASWV